MTSQEILDRVNACLDRLDAKGWPKGRPDKLLTQWCSVVGQFGADSPAALGVLLALVTEAWGQSCAAGGGVVIVESVGPRGGFFLVTEHLAPTQRFKAVGGERVNRLLAALEAAPK